MTLFDEDFTEDDMQFALFVEGERALICQGCGGFLDETMAPENADAYDAEVVACNRCAIGDEAERGHRNKPNAKTDGLRRRTWEIDR